MAHVRTLPSWPRACVVRVMDTPRVNNRLWLISDTHFGHHNIIAFQQRPATHETIMLSEWIWAVGEDDDILHLGDVFLGKSGNPARWASIISRLPGRKFLLMGNHDKAKLALYEHAGFTILDPFIHAGIAFSHRPVTKEYPLHGVTARNAYLLGAPVSAGSGWHTNIHGHIHGNKLGVLRDAEYAATVKHDGSPLEGKTYINMSVEVRDFKPVRLGNVCPLPRGDGA